MMVSAVIGPRRKASSYAEYLAFWASKEADLQLQLLRSLVRKLTTQHRQLLTQPCYVFLQQRKRNTLYIVA